MPIMCGQNRRDSWQQPSAKGKVLRNLCNTLYNSWSHQPKGLIILWWNHGAINKRASWYYDEFDPSSVWHLRAVQWVSTLYGTIWVNGKIMGYSLDIRRFISVWEWWMICRRRHSIDSAHQCLYYVIGSLEVVLGTKRERAIKWPRPK